jgi:hypothetical protein
MATTSWVVIAVWKCTMVASVSAERSQSLLLPLLVMALGNDALGDEMEMRIELLLLSANILLCVRGKIQFFLIQHGNKHAPL